jgi:hypothetical protein
MKNVHKLIFCAIMICVIGTTAGFATGALPPGNIVITPSSPAPLSTISISVTYNGEPTDVRVTVEECNGDTGICYPDIQNVSMSLGSANVYTAEVTLKHADATYITSEVVTKVDGKWTSFEKKNTTLSENTNGNNGNDGNTIPGFEVILFVIAVTLSIIAIGRKRVK